MFHTPGRRRGPGSPSDPEDVLYKRSRSVGSRGRHGKSIPSREQQRPLNSTRASRSKAKPGWIDTNNDLSQYKLTRDEIVSKVNKLDDVELEL